MGPVRRDFWRSVPAQIKQEKVQKYLALKQGTMTKTCLILRNCLDMHQLTFRITLLRYGSLIGVWSLLCAGRSSDCNCQGCERHASEQEGTDRLSQNLEPEEGSTTRRTDP